MSTFQAAMLVFLREGFKKNGKNILWSPWSMVDGPWQLCSANIEHYPERRVRQ
jgi:hypothetical protein